VAEEADRLVARAIESVLDQVPGAMDTTVPEASAAKMQPWAETAAPTGAHTKRPLEDLLGELEARVSANPGARATLPQTRHPALAFFDRFTKGARSPGGGGGERSSAAEPGSRRRRRRRGGSRTAPAAEVSTSPGPPAAEPGRGAGRRRSRRGRGRGGGGAATPSGEGSAGATPRSPVQGGPNPAAGAGEAGTRGGQSTGIRRRRGRRGRGGPRPPAA
jgi:hypothetical protein